MKVLLLHQDADFNADQELPWNERQITQDLALDILFDTMCQGDEFLLNIARKSLFQALDNDTDTITYRQAVLKDCLEFPDIITGLYYITIEVIENRRQSWYGIFTKHPSSVLSGAVGLMELYEQALRKLRSAADEHAGKFRSEGFVRFFEMIKKELDDDYLLDVNNHLNELKFRQGILASAALGKGNKGINYVLRKLIYLKQSWWEWLFPKKIPGYVFHINPRDESGTRALTEFNDQVLNLVANTVAQSADHMLGFFNTLRRELAFYMNCLNLKKQLDELGATTCFPSASSGEPKQTFKGLYDTCLALSMKQKIVANDLQADGKDLFIITGANQGGKSTFLRSIGLAQLMMQAGMFVAATEFRSNVCSSLFTHFKRKEDSTMNSGKFDEEMSRMNDMADFITSRSMLLFNESFAATNDREGSEIARQIISALLERKCKVFFVTHLYEFADNFHAKKKANVIFLRAERTEDMRRTFKVLEGEPLESSYGADIYQKIFKD